MSKGIWRHSADQAVDDKAVAAAGRTNHTLALAAQQAAPHLAAIDNTNKLIMLAYVAEQVVCCRDGVVGVWRGGAA